MRESWGRRPLRLILTSVGGGLHDDDDDILVVVFHHDQVARSKGEEDDKEWNNAFCCGVWTTCFQSYVVFSKVIIIN